MMMNNINILLKKLQNFKKVYNKLSKAVPNINSAEVTADNAFRQILDLLENPNINDPLNNLIFMARTTYSSEKMQDKSKFFEERIVMQEASISKRDLEYLYFIYQDVQQNVTRGKLKFSQEQFPSNASSLMQIVINLYNSIKAQLIKSRTLSRKNKKKEKKKLYQGIVSIILGLMAIIVNMNWSHLFEFSYALGFCAVYQASRDIADVLID